MSTKRPFIKFAFIFTSILLLVACGSTSNPTTVPTDNPQPTMVKNTTSAETATSVPVKDKPKPAAESIKPTTNPTPSPTPTTEPAPTHTPQPTLTSGPIDLPAEDTRIIPNVFVGSVTVNGQAAVDGTKISAWISDYSSPVGETTVAGGSYVMNVSQYGTVSFNGKTITFKIEDVDTSQTSTWETGGATIVDLIAN